MLPESVSAFAAFVAIVGAAICVAGATCYGISAARYFGDVSFAAVTSIAGLCGAAGLFSMSLVFEKTLWTITTVNPKSLGLIALDVVPLVILFLIMGQLTAVQVSTRFVLAPVLAILIGGLLTRSPLSYRTCFGLALMAGSSVWLLASREQATEENGLSIG
jgi:drug/metabolite transporter (DMT)-like permease